MSLKAIKIVQEELVEFRKGVLPNSRIIWQGGGDVETHSLLAALEAKITKRIEKECIEIPKKTLQETYTNLHEEDLPQCEIALCASVAVWEGWANKRDPLTREKLTVIRRLYVCNAHKDQLRGCANEEDVD
ncbi:hypothetical protein LCGC14_2071520 [marine sediment metagenome]|uniref:Uncharacterized protein n=1 Tax=marine sediment metagenome TaxID=412755 RepID=A0A0F9EIG6_9ZZZZ